MSASSRVSVFSPSYPRTPQGRRLVVVDGVGYPGVGSCTGTSNGSVARRIGARVVLVGRPGTFPSLLPPFKLHSSLNP